jgi:hypothetical protein
MSSNDPLDRLVAEQTRPDASDEERAAHRLILAAATDPARQLTEEELARIVRHIARAGFDPHALERARGTIVNRPRPGGGTVQTGERLPPAEIHLAALHRPAGMATGDDAAGLSCPLRRDRP